MRAPLAVTASIYRIKYYYPYIIYPSPLLSFQHQPEKSNWGRCSGEIKDKLSKRLLPTNCQKGEHILRAIILKAASRHIPSGRHRLNIEPVPTDILEKMRIRDDLSSRDSTSPALPEMNDEITRITNEHKRQRWRVFVETLDHKTDPINCGELSRHYIVNRCPRLRMRQSHLTTLKYPPQSR